jgi:hypothetical protein
MTVPSMEQLERIEREAWTDLARVMPAPLAQGIGLHTADIGSAYLFMASKVPQFQFNWLSGAGLNGDDGSSIDEAVKVFRDAGQRKFIIQIPPGPRAADCGRHAAALGLKEHALAWAKFQRATDASLRADTALEIREVGAAERSVFAATAVAGFGMPPAMAAWLEPLAGRTNWHTYVSFANGEPAGAAAMYVRGELAWLGIGATKPALRKHGSQSALLARRIADAAKLGARHATTETGVPQAGQPAPSYNNILKAGFSVAYVRANWAEPGG